VLKPLDTAPPTVRRALDRLYRRLRVHNVVTVPVRPEPDAVFDECFVAVAQKIRRDGGGAVYGWAIWADPLVVEAECHAVWQSPIGDLVDVTPKRNGAAAISFVHDPTIVDDGRQQNNVRVAVYEKDAVVDQFIRVCDEIFEVTNRGERADQLGMIAIPAEEIEPLIQKQARLARQMAERRFGADEACVCGSSRRQKHCCGA